MRNLSFLGLPAPGFQGPAHCPGTCHRCSRQLALQSHATPGAAGFVASQRGNGGGFCLRVDSDKTLLLEVIEAMEGPTSTYAWQLAPPANASPGAAFTLWDRAQASLRDVLASVSIGQLSRDTEVSRSKQLQLVVTETAELDPAALEVAANKGKCSPV